ncbi:hypothetical protein [Kitasatospora sp. NPDC094015]|uniref:hypothetical protein n=1 Tax=Kitasatospora sp. NPDC094015 TaxID=3155205 RepID=UPI003331791E
MTIPSALATFAATAAVGPVRCGAQLGEPARLLGPPHSIGRVGKRRRWPHLFAFGDLELCVCRCRLVTSVCVQTWRDTIDLPGAPGALAGRPTLTELTATLAAAGVAPAPLPHRDPPGQLTLQVPSSGVTLVFRTRPDADPVLESAGAWAPPHRCAPLAGGAMDDGFGA